MLHANEFSTDGAQRGAISVTSHTEVYSCDLNEWPPKIVVLASSNATRPSHYLINFFSFLRVVFSNLSVVFTFFLQFR